ncbi:MAG: hypothetical protein ACI971_000453, partial [Colwellia sp.]
VITKLNVIDLAPGLIRPILATILCSLVWQV